MRKRVGPFILQEIDGTWRGQWCGPILDRFATEEECLAALRKIEPKPASTNKPSTPCANCGYTGEAFIHVRTCPACWESGV